MEAGTIIGTVRAEGKPGVEAAAGGGNYASRKFKFVETIDYAALKDFVVYIDQPPATPPTPSEGGCRQPPPPPGPNPLCSAPPAV